MLKQILQAVGNFGEPNNLNFTSQHLLYVPSTTGLIRNAFGEPNRAGG